MTKKWLVKKGPNNFYRNAWTVRAKYDGKKSSEKCEKTILIITLISWPKKVGKRRAKQFFHKRTKSASKKCWEKNRRKKVRKTFFIFNECRDQNKRGNKRAKQNFQKR